MGIPMYGQNKDGDRLNQYADGLAKVKVISKSDVLTAADSGSYIVFDNAAANVTVDLPSPVAGMWFEFSFAGTAAEAQDYIIDTKSDTNYFRGGLSILDTDATTDGAEALVAILPDGNSNSTMTLKTIDNGTHFRLVSDGTLWYTSGQICSATATAVVYGDQP